MAAEDELEIEEEEKVDSDDESEAANSENASDDEEHDPMELSLADLKLVLGYQAANKASSRDFLMRNEILQGLA